MRISDWSSDVCSSDLIWGTEARITSRRLAANAGECHSMVEGLRDHPLRASLNAEVHSRPFARLQSPERISHLALLSGEGAAERERRHVAALCGRGARGLSPDRKSTRLNSSH